MHLLFTEAHGKKALSVGILAEDAGASAGTPAEDTDEFPIHRVSVMHRNAMGARLDYDCKIIFIRQK